MEKLHELSEEVLYINGQWRKLSSFLDLPVQFRDEIMPLGHFYYQKNEVWEVLSQKVNLHLFSIITHYVNPFTDMTIIPRSNKEILALHHLYGGQDIPAMTADGTGVRMKDCSVGLYILNDKENFAKGKAGNPFRSIQINIDIDKVSALVKKYPQLSLLLRNSVLHKEGPVNSKEYFLNDISQECIMHILYAKYVNATGRSFLRTQGRLLMEIFLNQYYAKEIACIEYSNIEVKQIGKCFSYLKKNLKLGVDTDLLTLAKKFRIRPETLETGFRTIYGLDLSRYVQMVRLNVSFKMLVQNCAIPLVAREICFCSEAKFICLFKSWFGITPGSISNAN